MVRLLREMGASTNGIEELYRRRGRAFRAALAGITGSYETAHDVVQESFARALARRQTYRGSGSLEAWVWAIAVRVALEQRRVPATVPLEEAFEPCLPDPERDGELGRVLQQLAPRRRLMVFLRFVADLSYAQIAELCGVSEGTVAATLAQAKQELTAAFADSDHDLSTAREATE